MSTVLSSPTVFLIGCPRSGTTLLHRMLDAHPALGLADEPHFVARAVAHLPVGADPVVTAALVDWLLASPRFARLSVAPVEVRAAAAGAPRFSAFVGRLFTAFARACGKPAAGEKAPYYARFVPHLAALFPAARFVHLVRDGRDVALSMVDWARRKGKGPVAKSALRDGRPVAAAALAWRDRAGAARRDGRALGPGRYLEVRYEDLVAEPARVARVCCAFVGLPFAERMLRFHEGRERPREGRSAKAAWSPPTPGLRAWRAAMAPADVALFEAIAGAELCEHGYPLGAAGGAAAVGGLVAESEAVWRAEQAASRRAREAECAGLFG